MLAFAALCWSGNHIIARAVANQVPPWSLNFLRWLCVVLIMAVVAAPSLRRDWPLIKAHAWVLMFLGVAGGGLFGTLQYIGLKYTGALNMGVMNSVAPALIALASFVIFRDAIGWLQLLQIRACWPPTLPRPWSGLASRSEQRTRRWVARFGKAR